MNYTDAISATYNPVQPGSKVIRTDTGSYTREKPYITDKYDAPPGRTMSQGYPTNGTVKISYETRTKDQSLVNIFNMAFIDTERPDKLIIRSLQQVNEILASRDEFRIHRRVFDDRGGRYYEVTRPDPNGQLQTVQPNIDAVYYDLELDDTDSYCHKVSKEKILDRFQFIGTIHNNDVDTDPYKHKGRLPRAFTVAVKGATHVLDYWSNSKRMVSGYSTCYLILKQVKIYKDYRDAYIDKIPGTETVRYPDYQQYNFQTDLNSSSRAVYRGQPHFETEEKFRYIWQFVPYFDNRGQLPTEKYMFYNCRGKREFGSYIRVGYVHEYPQLSRQDVFSKRNEFSVARDIVYAHENAIIIPYQFYLLRTNKNILH